MDSSQNNILGWDQLAQKYQDKFMDLSIYNDSYDQFCNLITKNNPSIFEVACGPGNVTKYIYSKRPDCTLEAIDASPKMIELAVQNNPGVRFGVMDCRSMDSIKSTYDAAIIGFCLPYLSYLECSKLVSDIGNMLNENGIIYLSFIEGPYSQSKIESSSDGLTSLFVYYYQEKDLVELLEKNRFTIIKSIKIPLKKSDGKLETHLIILAQYGAFNNK